jgi:hypothetical protein
MIYHGERALEIDPDFDEKEGVIKLLKSALAKHQASDLGPNAKVVRVLEPGGDASDFVLPDDRISAHEKGVYKTRAVERVKAYDAALPSEYPSDVSDKTVNDIEGLLKQDVDRIQTLHFKVFLEKTPAQIQETWYASPDRVKSILYEGDTIKDIALVTGSKAYDVDPVTGEARPDEFATAEAGDYLHILGKITSFPRSPSATFKVRKALGCAQFLSEHCATEPPNLYVVLLSQEERSNPIVYREFFVDTDRRIVLGDRSYWTDLPGPAAGRPEKPSAEQAMRSFQVKGGILFTAEGYVKGLIEDLSQLSATWRVEILSLNEPIDESVFAVRGASP